MSISLFQCEGGTLLLPDPKNLLIGRIDGGNLVVNPPVPIWERSELTRDQLMMWSFLVAAAGRAMLDSLPHLEGGCINYWEAGNWALNYEAEPKGSKKAMDHRRVHLHLLGRNRSSSNPHWKWGESPVFPAFADRDTWSSNYERLNPEECRLIVNQTHKLLKDKYGFQENQTIAGSICRRCEYPFSSVSSFCEECSSAG